MPGACDVADGMIEHRLVERQRRDRRDERDEVEHAEDTRPSLVDTHACSDPLSPAMAQADSRATQTGCGGSVRVADTGSVPLSSKASPLAASH
jgi:hypothetical protein